MNNQASTTSSAPPPSIFHDLTFDEYKQIKAINASSLKPWLISARHAKFREANPLDTDSIKIGRAVHSYLLDDDFHDQYACLDDTELIQQILAQRPELKNVRASKEYKTKYAEWSQLNEHKTLLKKDEMDTVAKSRRAIYDHPESSSMNLDTELREVTLVWDDPQVGGLCKARLDLYNHKTGRIVDIKTTAKRPTVRAVERQIIDYAYHVQYAWYMRAVRMCRLSDAPTMRFVFVQLADEFDVTWADPDESMLDQGWHDAMRAVERMRACEAEGKYPGVHPDPVQVSLPAWVFDDTEIIDDGTEVIG